MNITCNYYIFIKLRIFKDSDLFPVCQGVLTFFFYLTPIYASPTSGEAYRDQRLTTNFEL